MISEYRAKKYCIDDISLIENYDKAINDSAIWDCHHRDEIKVLPSGMIAIRAASELKENGRYYDCPANELIFLSRKEHWKLHSKYANGMQNKKQVLSPLKRCPCTFVVRPFPRPLYWLLYLSDSIFISFEHLFSLWHNEIVLQIHLTLSLLGKC